MYPVITLTSCTWKAEPQKYFIIKIFVPAQFSSQSVLVICKCKIFFCFREELSSFHREIEVLSEQYSQKCLENAHLAQALEAERQALRQCQRENQELNAHNQVPAHTQTHTLALTILHRSMANVFARFRLLL